MTLDDTQTHITELLQKAAQSSSRPDGSSYVTLYYKDELDLVKRTGLTHHQIQYTALKNDILPERYARNQTTLSTSDQLDLLQAHVAIIGLGGLGGTVAEILARIGIGKLTLVDGDVFEDSNLNRQLLSTSENLGQHKADIATSRVKAVNPGVNTTPIHEYFSEKNGARILQTATIAVDCLDTIPARFTLEKACKDLAIPMVSAAIAGTSGQATVIFPDDTTLSSIYGHQHQRVQKGIEMSLGTLPYAAIAMAAIECAEIVSLAISRPAELRKKLLITDFQHQTMDKIVFG